MDSDVRGSLAGRRIAHRRRPRQRARGSRKQARQRASQNASHIDDGKQKATPGPGGSSGLGATRPVRSTAPARSAWPAGHRGTRRASQNASRSDDGKQKATPGPGVLLGWEQRPIRNTAQAQPGWPAGHRGTRRASLHHLLETEAPLQLHSSPRRSEAHWGASSRARSATPASSPSGPRPPRKPSQGGCRLLLPSVDMGSILGRSPVSLHHLLETEAPLQLHSSPRRSEAHWGGLERRPFRYACVEPVRAVTAGRQTSPGVLRQVEWSSGSGTIRGGGAGRGPLAQPARSAASNASFRMARPCQLPAAGSQRFQR